jgi:hypothetical protein
MFPFSVSFNLTSRCLATDLNNVLCFRAHYLTGSRVPQVIQCSNYRLPTNSSAYNIFARTARRTRFLCCCFQLLLCKHACVGNRYLVMAVVLLLTLPSLSINESTCRNIRKSELFHHPPERTEES